MIEVSALKDWLGLISLMISVGTSIVLFVGSGSKKNAEQLEKLEEKVGDHGGRISAIETNMMHLPSRETAHKLELALAQISGRLDSMDAQIEGRMNAMDERLKPIAATSERLHELLMEQARK